MTSVPGRSILAGVLRSCDGKKKAAPNASKGRLTGITNSPKTEVIWSFDSFCKPAGVGHPDFTGWWSRVKRMGDGFQNPVVR